MQNLLGVVMCGGESKRMGSDKGLLQIDDTIWALYIANKLKPFQIPVIFSVNNTQVENYELKIAKEKLVIDSVDVKGPLRGLLSVHKNFPENNLLLLACDMLDLDEITIKKIIEIYKEQPEFDFYVFQDDFAQPFCGIYTSKGLKEVFDKASKHSILKFSLQKVLDDGKTKRIPLDNLLPFKNYNFLDNNDQKE